MDYNVSAKFHLNIFPGFEIRLSKLNNDNKKKNFENWLSWINKLPIYYHT